MAKTRKVNKNKKCQNGTLKERNKNKTLQTFSKSISKRKITSKIFNVDNRIYNTMSRKLKISKDEICDTIKNMQPLVKLEKYR